ncbi:MAG: hypothetical protein HOV68_23265 [Streptomycetaceae bacterium]|nr:hypothetical protein [Streptomycetaceae bacterium]
MVKLSQPNLFSFSALAVASVLAASVLAVSGCDSGGDDGQTTSISGRGTTSSATGVPNSPSVPPSPTITRVSPQAFGQALAALETAVGPAFADLGKADTPDKLSAAFEQAATRTGTAKSDLALVTPPEAAEAGTTALLDALADLGDDLKSLSSDASNAELCTAASGVPRLSNLPSVTAVRNAAGTLAAVDPAYKIGAFLPAAQAEPNRQGSDGSLGGGRRGGSGELTIKNEQGGDDALIRLTNGSAVVREVYVRGGSETTVDAIPDGTLTAFYTSGKDWDAGAKKFTRDCAFQKFDDTLDYRTTSTQYTTYELTLYTVVGGNATTSDVPPDQFPS